MSIFDTNSGFNSIIRQVAHSGDEKVFDPNHHEKFNYQGLIYLIHNPYELFSKDSVLHQSILNHSMDIYLNPQKTIIDKALESYEPKR